MSSWVLRRKYETHTSTLPIPRPLEKIKDLNIKQFFFFLLYKKYRNYDAIYYKWVMVSIMSWHDDTLVIIKSLYYFSIYYNYSGDWS